MQPLEHGDQGPVQGHSGQAGTNPHYDGDQDEQEPVVEAKNPPPARVSPGSPHVFHTPPVWCHGFRVIAVAMHMFR